VVPDSLNFIDLFQNNWSDQIAKTMGTDFSLHSSLDDAMADEDPWTYCNYGLVGFPRDCGPSGYVG
jgi:hypothetical protein